MAGTNHGGRSNTDDAQVLAWIKRDLGAEVVAWERQPRWRPMWFVDVERNGMAEKIVVRGERADCPLVFPLKHEMTFQRLLDEHGIPVPKVLGWCDDPAAYAMSTVPGRPDFKGVTAEDRATIVDEYLQILARLHTLPVDAFARAGIVRGTSPADAAYVGARQFDRVFRSTKVRPDPLMEFALGWLRRHPLPSSNREGPVVWDSGQFHHDGKNLLAVIDVEIGHLGDPMMDLAAWRMRDTVIPYGDFDVLYDRYAELTGNPVDRAAIQWHHLFFTLTNELSFHKPMAKPVPETDYMTYAQWISETNLHTVETMAEYLGVELDDVDVPAPTVSPVSPAHEHLSWSLRNIKIDDPFVTYQVRIAFRLARHLERYDQIGAEVMELDRADVAALTGAATANWAESENQLERFVLADEGRHDAELVQLFNRRWRRYKALMGPPGSAMTAHHTMQPLGRSLLGGLPDVT